MHPSERIEIYCMKIREKFYSNRKMSYAQKVEHTKNVVKTLNFGSPNPLCENFILKILELDQDDSIEYLS